MKKREKLTEEKEPIKMQDEIMKMKIGRPLKADERVEFVNGNTLDCRRENLRLVRNYIQ